MVLSATPEYLPGKEGRTTAAPYGIMMNACTQHGPNLNDQQINEVIPMLLKAHLGKAMAAARSDDDDDADDRGTGGGAAFEVLAACRFRRTLLPWNGMQSLNRSFSVRLRT